MHILVATDAEYVLTDVTAALGGPDVSFTVVSDGRAVVDAVKQRMPDVAVLDLQVGSMGGMAMAMALRLDASAGVIDHVKIVMLLDRAADVHLAKRCGAEAWVTKPLSPLTLRRTVSDVINPPVAAIAADSHVADDAADSAEQVPVTSG